MGGVGETAYARQRKKGEFDGLQDTAVYEQSPQFLVLTRLGPIEGGAANPDLQRPRIIRQREQAVEIAAKRVRSLRQAVLACEPAIKPSICRHSQQETLLLLNAGTGGQIELREGAACGFLGCRRNFSPFATPMLQQLVFPLEEIGRLDERAKRLDHKFLRNEPSNRELAQEVALLAPHDGVDELGIV